VRSQALTAFSMEAALFWDMTPCPDVSKDPVAFVILTLDYSETSAQLYRKTRRHIPEDSILQPSSYLT